MKYAKTHPAFNWREYVEKIPQGETNCISWAWRLNGERIKFDKLVKLGYYQKRSSKGIDAFTRTGKSWAEPHYTL